MIRIRNIIAFACIAAVLSACGSKQAKEEPAPAAAAPAAAEAAPTPMVEATAASLNVRAKASPSGAVLGSIKRGERARPERLRVPPVSGLRVRAGRRSGRRRSPRPDRT